MRSKPRTVADDLDCLDLRQLAEGFLGWKKFQLHKSVSATHSSRTYNYELLLAPEGQLVALLIKDYSRTCGVNVIQHFSQLLEWFHPQVSQAMVISNQFSAAARATAKKAKMELLARGELVSIYRINQIPVPVREENLTPSECSQP